MYMYIYMYIRAPRFDLLFHTTLVNLNTGHFHHIEVLVLVATH